MAVDWTKQLERQLIAADALTIWEAFSNVDWSKTCLGPTNTWSAGMRAHVRNLFQISTPMALYLGDDCVLVYNHASLDFFGKRHPHMMGKPIAIAFADIEDQAIVTMIEDCRRYARNAHIPPSMIKLPRLPMHLIHEDAEMSDDMSAVPILFLATWDIIPLTEDDGSCFGIALPWTIATELYFSRAQESFMRRLELIKTQIDYISLDKAYEDIKAAINAEIVLFPTAILFSRSDEAVYKAKINIGTSYDGHAIDISLPPPAQNVQLHQFLSDSQKSAQLREIKGLTDISSALENELRPRYTFVRPIIGVSDKESPEWIFVLGANPLRPMDDSYRDSMASACDAVSSVLVYVAQKIAYKLSEKRFANIVKQMPVGLQLKNRQSARTIYTNAQWRNMYNVPDSISDTDPVLKELAMNAVHPASQAVLVQQTKLFEASLCEERPVHWDHHTLRLNEPPNGQEKKHPEDETWFELSSWTIGEDEIVITTLDVSAYHNGLRRVLAFSKLENDRNIECHRADLAEHETRRHLEFIDYFSHELRNPLGAIFHSTELSQDVVNSIPVALPADTSQELTQSLDTIALCAQHMRRIMDDTLLFSQLQSGKLSICKVATNVPKLLQTLCGMFRNECRIRGITLDLELSNWHHDQSELYIDPNRLTQILINLVTNSMKFVSKTGNGTICVQAESTNIEASKSVALQFSVLDNGLPMNDEEIEQLFQRFQQANKKTHIEYGGSGLGLFICHELMQMMDGSITASRNRRGGMTFTCRLEANVLSSSIPINGNDESTTQQIPSAPHATHSAPTSTSENSNPIAVSNDIMSCSATTPVNLSKTVLLVEDNIVNQRLMQRQLKKSGYQVLVANNGQEALDHFQADTGKTIDLCLCDIEMPIMDGYETVTQVRAYQAAHKQASTPFLAISANARPEQIKRQMDAGMTATLSKPFTFAAMVEAIETMVTRHGS